MPSPQRWLKKAASRLRLGLFSRSFLLLAALMLVSLGAWLQVFFGMEEGPRAVQMAQRVATAVSITRSALIYAPTSVRPALLLDLATKESLRVQPREGADVMEPLPDSNYWRRVASEIKQRLGPTTQIEWTVNQTPGIWVSFEINNDQYWLVFDREQLGLTAGIEWFGWGATALLLALIGAAVSVRFVNRPLAQLAKVAQQLARGENPSPLPEKGPLEIREMNIAFNRMARDLRQTEADREIMLAGISHDLRTPLARMRLEIEMSAVDDEARQAIDEDLGQIDHSIGQLMEYARPAGVVPGATCTNASAAIPNRWAANSPRRSNRACAPRSPRTTSSASSAISLKTPGAMAARLLTATPTSTCRCTTRTTCWSSRSSTGAWASPKPTSSGCCGHSRAANLPAPASAARASAWPSSSACCARWAASSSCCRSLRTA
jgi:signal transduction histidine kinase